MKVYMVPFVFVLHKAYYPVNSLNRYAERVVTIKLSKHLFAT